MNEMFRKLAENMAIKIRVMNIYVGGFENKRECPFYSELKGFEQALKAIGIDFEYEFNQEVTEITAVSVMGHKVEI